jgi:hypothetical protein
MLVLRKGQEESFYFGHLAFLFLDIDVSVGIKITNVDRVEKS